jgi:hypothetical protein
MKTRFHTVCALKIDLEPDRVLLPVREMFYIEAL